MIEVKRSLMRKSLVSLEQINFYIENHASKGVPTSAFPALSQSHEYKKYTHF